VSKGYNIFKEITRMKLPILISCLAFLAMAQTSIPHGTYEITGQSQSTNGDTMHAYGNVTFETDTMVIRADAADFNSRTKEIVAHGEVRIQLK